MSGKTRNISGASVLLLLALTLVGNGADAAMLKVITRDRLPNICYNGTSEDVVSMVENAVNLVSEKGPETAFRQFMIPDGGYLNGDLYVFVLDQAGTVLAHGNAPRSVGANAIQSRDRNGKYFVRSILLQAAARGSGWVDYEWFSPCTGELATKVVYFKTVGDFVICVGLYKALEAMGSSIRSNT